jgi:N-acetylglucosaminyldiphosphoundecaprenol N-acetyl-beta-D-mannosaminyltransferase
VNVDGVYYRIGPSRTHPHPAAAIAGLRATPRGATCRLPDRERATGIPAPSRVDVLGTRLAVTDYAAMIAWIDAMIAGQQRGYVCVCNVHTVMAAREDRELHRALERSSLNVPDGQPLVWAINALTGTRLRDRVYGPDLMALACEHAAQTGARFYLYGGRNQGALVQLALNLRRRYPGVRIVGGYSPPHRPLDDEERAAVAAEVNRLRADVVWVGIGVPKQEKWMAQMREALHAPVLIGVGAAFDFHAGLVPQAPSWLQTAGLEWAYRLAHEPRRLWRRYLRYNPRFVVALARQLAAERAGGR